MKGGESGGGGGQVEKGALSGWGKDNAAITTELVYADPLSLLLI